MTTVVTRKRPAAKPAKCRTCQGTGEVATTVRVGRRRREVGQQSGLCLTCLGSGTAD